MEGSSRDNIYRSERRFPIHWWKNNDRSWRILRWSLALFAVILVLGLVIYFLLIDMQIAAKLVAKPVETHQDRMPDTQWSSEVGSSVNDIVSLDGDLVLDLGGVSFNDGSVTPKQTSTNLANNFDPVNKSEVSGQDYVENIPPQNFATPTASEEVNVPTSRNYITETVYSDKQPTSKTEPSYLLTKLQDAVKGVTAESDSPSYSSEDIFEHGDETYSRSRSKVPYKVATAKRPVYPTIPSVVETHAPVTNYSDSEGECFSPRLAMCRGVLPYDLTTLPLIPGITQLAQLDAALPYFEMILESGCSPRARQFICSLLEPECQPGDNALLPCRKACKVVAEDCSDFILAALDLSQAFKCDSYPDLDEPDQCVNFAKGDACLKNEFHCPDGTCIPERWVCDTVNDCPMAADELNCTASCNKDEFRCESDDKCISSKWRCDGQADCQDGSDELKCPPPEDLHQLTAMPHTSPCPSGELRCLDGRCITLHQLCDGKQDCADSADEANC